MQKVPDRIGAEDYLKGELLSDIKHQLIDGEVYAMPEVNENHNLLAGNIASELRSHLKGKPCRTFMADMKVRVMDDFFIPMSWWFARKTLKTNITKDRLSSSLKCCPKPLESLIKPASVCAAKTFPRCRNTC